MRLLTFNIRNRYEVDNYNGIYRKKDTVRLLAKFIKENKIDVLCTQEMTEIYKERLISYLDDYVALGNLRFKSKFLIKLKQIKRYNEAVAIFTKEKVIGNWTRKMPFFPDILPRVVTILKLDSKIGQVIIMNTHLSAYNKISKKRQVKYLLKLIKKIKYPIILTGDFNMNIKSDVLNYFINELKKLNIKHLDIKGRTFKKSKCNMPIDHIFVSNNLNIKNIEVIKDDTLNFSDHYPILLEIIDNIS